MKILSSKVLWLVLGGLVVASTMLRPMAAPSDFDLVGKKGILACGGNHVGDVNDPLSMGINTRWIFRNFDPQSSIAVTRVRITDAVGAVLFDSDVAGALPPASNGADPANIGPNNTLMYVSHVLAQSHIPALNTAPHGGGPHPKRPLQFILHWEAKPAALSLDGEVVQQYHQIDMVGINRPYARSSGSCRTVEIK